MRLSSINSALFFFKAQVIVSQNLQPVTEQILPSSSTRSLRQKTKVIKLSCEKCGKVINGQYAMDIHMERHKQLESMFE